MWARTSVGLLALLLAAAGCSGDGGSGGDASGGSGGGGLTTAAGGGSGSPGTGGTTGGTGGTTGGTGGTTGGTGGTTGGTGGGTGGVPQGLCPAQPVDPTFTLRWEDNFDAWDGGRWNTATHTFAENLAQFAPDAVVVEDGYLKIRLTAQRTGERDYRSGEVRTNDDFRYGRFDTCARWGRGSGIVGSFFTYTYDPWNEIDIEYLGGNPVGIQYNLIWDEGGGNVYRPTFDPTGWDGADDFHHYSIEWTPNEIRFYIDGQLRHTQYDGAAQMNQTTTLRVNLWPTDTGFAGSYDPGAIPTESWYDWVRVYDYSG